MKNFKPLFVDLDGTLIQEDLSHKAFFYFLKSKPLTCFYYLVLFLIRGRPYLKEKISNKYIVELSQLKVNQNCIKYIKEAKKNHRVVYLISGSHQLLVNQISNQINLFNKVFGTHESFNMVGKNKIDYINDKLNIKEFDYIGNSFQDIPIWEYTKKIIYTNASTRLKNKLLSMNQEMEEIKANFT